MDAPGSGALGSAQVECDRYVAGFAIRDAGVAVTGRQGMGPVLAEALGGPDAGRIVLRLWAGQCPAQTRKWHLAVVRILLQRLHNLLHLLASPHNLFGPGDWIA